MFPGVAYHARSCVQFSCVLDQGRSACSLLMALPQLWLLFSSSLAGCVHRKYVFVLGTDAVHQVLCLKEHVPSQRGAQL